MITSGTGFAAYSKKVEGFVMKKVKIPLEFLFKLFENGLGAKSTSETDRKSEKIIEQNKKYFIHIGIG